MKKLLLLAYATLSLCCYAQNTKINPQYFKTYPPVYSVINESENVKQSKNQNFKFITPQQSQALCNGTVFTFGPNAFGVGGSISTYKQNCLTYNSDLNAVLWVQRASPLWNFQGTHRGQYKQPG